MNRTYVSKYFDQLENVLKQNDLTNKPENLWNMDETGCSLSHNPGFIIAKTVFGPFKKAYNKVCGDLMNENPGTVVSKGTFCGLLEKAWVRSMTAANLKSGFRACGVYPFGAHDIPNAAFHPNSATRLQSRASNTASVSATATVSAETADVPVSLYPTVTISVSADEPVSLHPTVTTPVSADELASLHPTVTTPVSVDVPVSLRPTESVNASFPFTNSSSPNDTDADVMSYPTPKTQLGKRKKDAVKRYFGLTMPGQKNYRCACCNKQTKPEGRRHITGETYKSYREYLNITNNDETLTTCGKCYIKFRRTSDEHLPVVGEPVQVPSNICDVDYIPKTKRQKAEGIVSPKNIALPIGSTGKSHSTCCVCKRRGHKLIVVPSDCRYRLFVENGKLLLAGARCCIGHLDDGFFTDHALTNYLGDSFKGQDHSNLNRSDTMELINNVRSIAINNQKYRIDFNQGSSLQDSDYLSLTGITKENFDDVCSHIKDSNIRSTKNRTMRTCVALLLVKLRAGISNKLLSTLFNIGKSSVQRAIVSARKALSEHFTRNYVGFQHITGNEVIKEHTRPLAQELFGSIINKPAILVLDGTYIYIQKYHNFKFQRRSYSMHKNRPLVKPMMYVTTTGYIVSVLGPYLADYKNNDANILKHNVKGNMENLTEWIKEEDVMVVDRGFRDSIDMLTEMGIHTEMPRFLSRGQKQFTTEEANSSRLVTKIRWIVESVNGRIKQWKFLQNIVPNNQIPYIGDYVQLICALCNRYLTPLNRGDSEEDQLLGAKMKVLASKQNGLQERVISERLDRRTGVWVKLDASEVVPQFPKLSEEDARNITFGVYQLKLAQSYTQEHLTDDGDYIIMANGDISNIVRVQIQSRHISSKKYMLWIQYDEAYVTSWYCQCRAGARVLGTYAHVSSAIWYLGFARHQPSISGVRN
ncbi:uncharacterized protein LOC117316313 [Pecten maximus]|uniref:uncharacterized protein LOC117316313 n=1 Tax=Pecten maximus TaxID=6579 RepID=UPI0014588A2A|nr:uncharacterized protein LOC117316313 [Pecten maximus]